MDKNPSTATVKTPSSNFTGDVWMNPVFGGDGKLRVLESADGKSVSLADFKDKDVVVVVVTCNHCPVAYSLELRNATAWRRRHGGARRHLPAGGRRRLAARWRRGAPEHE